MIGIIKYGMGNVSAFYNFYKSKHIPVEICSNPEKIQNYKKIILPGVGAFDSSITLLKNTGMFQALDLYRKSKENKILGVCVGMQIMFNKSEEGRLEGFGWLNCNISKLTNDTNVILPHLGWNNCVMIDRKGLFENIKLSDEFYYLHSYCLKSLNVDTLHSVTEYSNVQFVSAFSYQNIMGCQFHPEKSGLSGEKVLLNYWNI
jgi:glutamine amidotransferase